MRNQSETQRNEGKKKSIFVLLKLGMCLLIYCDKHFCFKHLLLANDATFSEVTNEK